MATRQLRLEDVVQNYSSDNGSGLEHFLDDKRDHWPGFSTKLLPWPKKKNHLRDSRREERCSTCDIMLDHKRSAQGKVRSATVRDFCPALIARDRA